MQELLIENIRTDGTQSRAAVNKEYVAELVELLNSGKKLPPVDVYRSDAGCFMADGFHRLLAHQEAGKRTIRAEVHKGGLKESRWHSIGANQDHGLRRTNADKRHAVEMALQDKPTASDHLIADHCGVSHTFVAGVRRTVQLATVASCDRVGADGKTRKLPPPPPPPQRVTTEEPEKQRAKLPPPPPPPPPASNFDDKPENAIPRDEIGNEIPDHLQGLFARASEVQALLTALSNVRGVIRAAADDPLYFECNAQSVATGIAQAYDAIKATTPYAVCPWCHGKAPMQKTCRGCGGRGLIGKFRYDTAVPRELKK